MTDQLFKQYDYGTKITNAITRVGKITYPEPYTSTLLLSSAAARGAVKRPLFIQQFINITCTLRDRECDSYDINIIISLGES